MTHHQQDFLRWVGAHVLAIVAFMAFGAAVAEFTYADMSSGWGETMRRELIMTSGAWGSWMFLASARTRLMRAVARFTIMVPGLAMLAMTAQAFRVDYDPDRWVQWLLAGCFSLWVAATSGPTKRSLGTHPWLFAAGVLASVVGWRVWLMGAEAVGDPTRGLWWGAPVVATLFATILPRLIAGSASRDAETDA